MVRAADVEALDVVQRLAGEVLAAVVAQARAVSGPGDSVARPRVDVATATVRVRDVDLLEPKAPAQLGQRSLQLAAVLRRQTLAQAPVRRRVRADAPPRVAKRRQFPPVHDFELVTYR
jgi:hypothetical protein